MRIWTRLGLSGAGMVLAASMLAGAASAQENLDAGKSGAQLYASNCAICHKSAQALNKSGGGLFGLDSFLREHYTSSRESAAAISAYLKSVGGGPAEHDKPAMGEVHGPRGVQRQHEAQRHQRIGHAQRQRVQDELERQCSLGACLPRMRCSLLITAVMPEPASSSTSAGPALTWRLISCWAW